MPPEWAAFCLRSFGAPSQMGRRGRAVQAFCPQGKTLAEAEFISAEHFDSSGARPGTAGLGSQEVRPQGCPSRSQFRQALIYLPDFPKCRPNGRHFACAPSGPHRRWGGADAPYKRFAPQGKTLAEAEFISAEHFDSSGARPGTAGLGSQEVRPQGCSSRASVQQALILFARLPKMPPEWAAFCLRSFGPHRRWAARTRRTSVLPAGAKLGGGGIHFREHFDSSGARPGTAGLGSQEVRPQGCPSRAAVQQAADLSIARSKIPPLSWRDFFVSGVFCFQMAHSPQAAAPSKGSWGVAPRSGLCYTV